MAKPLVIGLGTGRCGTQSLAALLQLQAELPSHKVHENSVTPYLTPATRWPPAAGARRAAQVGRRGHGGKRALRLAAARGARP